MQAYALFLLFVAIAVYAQNLTGFALALILLGLVGAFDLLPLPDVVNAVTVIGVVNAFLFLRQRGAVRLERPLWPALGASLVGTIIGTVALTWIAGSALNVLSLVLGVSIIICALVLWRAAKPLQAESSRNTFLSVGLLSGLMGGMFAAPGPPLAYQVYRQPWPIARMQESLVYLFGVGALLRLLVVVPTGTFTMQSLKLAALATPVVIVVTRLTATRPPPMSPVRLRQAVCMLLIASGIALVNSSLPGLSTQ